jgi:hypothetical protein
MLVAELLDIKVVHFECGVSDVQLLAGLGHLEEKGMMIGEFKAAIDVEEAGDGVVVLVHDVRHGECQCLGVPVEELLVLSLGIRDTIVAPAVNRGWTVFEPLEPAFAGLLVLVVDGELLQMLLVGFSAGLAVHEMDLVAHGICERDYLAATGGVERSYGRCAWDVGCAFELRARLDLVGGAAELAFTLCLAGDVDERLGTVPSVEDFVASVFCDLEPEISEELPGLG